MRSLSHAFVEGLAAGSGCVLGALAVGALALKFGPTPPPPEQKTDPVHLHVVGDDKAPADIRGLWEETVAE